jgi:nucleotide-binding universal stress UspA family protein
MYRKILVPLDGSQLSESVLPHVRTIAKGCEKCEIILFRVCEPPVLLADYPPDLKTRWEEHVQEENTHIAQQCRLYLTDAEQKLKEDGFQVTTESGLGKAAEEIIDYAQKNQVDLIVMASHGHSGATRWAYGNTANKVLQASKVPVLVVKPGQSAI